VRDDPVGQAGLGALGQLGLLVGPLLSMIDSSVVNVAVSDIGRDLHAGLRSVSWVVSGYLLALAGGLAATSYLAKRFGTLRIYRLSLIGFLVASAACALAPTIGILILARCAQGLFGAPLVPLAMNMLLGRGNGDRQLPAAAAMLFFLAPALGPSLGGGLIATGGWRLIFLINVPIGLLGLAGMRRICPASVLAPEARTRLDPVGLILLAGGMVCALYAATQGSELGSASVGTILPLTAGLALLLGYVGWERYHDQPAVGLALLRHPQSRVALGLAVLSAVVTFATIFLLPVFAQSVQRHSALATGLALLPQGVLTGLGTALGQHLHNRVATRTMVVAGFLVLTVSSACLLLLTAQTPLWLTALILSGRGLAIGLVISPLLSAMLQPLTDAQLADANTLFNIVQRLGGSIGVGLIGSLLASRAMIAGGLRAFHEVAVVLAGLAALAAVLSLKLAPTRQPASRS